MKSNMKGFSLVELLAVMAILGVLAAIAIPIYDDYRERAFRDSAKAALSQGAQNMERFFTRNNTYVAAVIGDPAAGDQVLQTTESGRYNLTFVDPNGVINPNPTANAFTIWAVSIDNTVACPVMTINQLGATTPAACW